MRTLYTLLLLLFAGVSLSAQVEFKVAYDAGSETYQFIIVPSVTWTGAMATTSNAQVSMRVPTGNFTVSDLQANYGNWTLSNTVHAPQEAPGYSYIIFAPQGIITTIPYQAGQEAVVFTFKNTGDCTGALEIVDNDTDPMVPNNSQNIQAGNLLVTLGGGPGQNTFDGPADVGSADCSGSGPVGTCGVAIDNVTSTSPSACGLADGTISVTARTEGLPLQYTIDNGVNWQTDPTFTGLAAGSIFYVKARDIAAICEETWGQLELDAPDPATINGTTSTDPSCGIADGTITIDATVNGTGVLSYSKDGGLNWQSSNVFTNLAEGSYEVYIRNGNGSCQKKVGDFSLTEDCAGPPTCPVEFVLEMQTDGSFLFSIIPDVDWNFPQNITSTAQVTLRVPTGGFVVSNLQSEIAALSWSQNSRQDAPAEAPQYDYISFGLNNFGTQAIPYVAGQKVPLFSFENTGACTGNLVELIDNDTDPFLPPNSMNANVGQQLTVSGWGSSGMPICINSNNVTDCQGVACPGASVSPDNSAVCAGESVTLNLNSAPGTISWSPAASLSCSDCPAPEATPSVTTTYTATIDDGAGCVTTAMAVVNVIDSPVAAFTADDGCVGDAVAFTNTTTNDGDVVEWNWSFGDNTTVMDRDPSHIYQTGGVYTVTLEARSSGGCISTTTRTVEIFEEIDPQLGADKEICQGGGTQLQAAGGNNYVWTPATGLNSATVSNPIASPTETTTYTVQVTNAQGCTGTGTITVRVDPIPTIADVTTVDPTNCQNPDGAISVDAAVSSGSLLYSIDGGTTWQPSSDFTALDAGTYSVQVANDQGTCPVNYLASQVVLDGAQGPVIANVLTTEPAACDGVAGRIEVQLTTAFAGARFSIDGGATYQTDPVFADVDAGTYQVQVTTADGSCTDVAAAPTVLTDNSSLAIQSVTATAPSGCGTADAQLTVTVDGGTSTQYSIDDGATWQADGDFGNLAAGSYTVRVRKGNCESPYPANPVQISDPSGPTVVAVTGNDAICEGGSSTITVEFSEAIGAQTITGGAYSDVTVQGNSVTFLATSAPNANDYSIDVTSTGGCGGAAAVSLNVSDAPVADIMVSAATCVEGQVQINYTGDAGAGAQLDWMLSGADVIYTSPATTQQPAGAQLIVQWSDAGNKPVELTVTENGCTADGAETVAVVDFEPVVTVTPTQPSGCGAADGALTVELDNADDYTYTWTDANSVTYTTQNLTDLPGGTFELTITEPTSGCTYATSAVLTDSDVFEVQSLTTTNDVDCGDAAGTITATVTPNVGPYQYMLYRSADMSAPLDVETTPTAQFTFKQLESDAYTVVVETQTDCADQADATIDEDTVPEPLQAVQVVNTTCDAENGTLSIEFGPQLATYGYELRRNGTVVASAATVAQSTAQLTDLAPGSYELTVRNDNGCVSTNTIQIDAEAPQTDLAWEVTQPGCDTDDGTISLDGPAGTSYAWSSTGGASLPATASVSGLAADVYTVTITDANGCTATQTHILAPSNAAAVSTEVLSGGGCADNAGSVAVSLDVSADYTYTVLGTGITGSFNGTDHLIEGLPGGDYTITFAVANSNDCESTATVSIATHTEARFTEQVLTPSDCGVADGQLCLTLLDGEGPFSVQTDQGTAPAAFTNDGCITGLQGGTVNLTITDGTGCLTTMTVALDYDEMPTLDAAAFELSTPACAGETAGSITALDGASYTVLDADGTLIGTTPVSNLAEGTYTVQTTQGSCTATLDLVINAPASMTATSTVQAEDCDGGNGALTLVVSGGVEPYTYEWSNGETGVTVNSLTAEQTLDVVIFDAFGCQIELTGLAAPYDCTECAEVFANETYTVQQQEGRADICLPMTNTDLNDYELILEGIPYTAELGSCIDSVIFYGYNTLVAQGTGPYRLERWAHGIEVLTAVDFNTIDELVAAMNDADPLGNWTHDADAQTISGGDGFAYGELTLTHLGSANTFTYALNFQAVATLSIELYEPGTYQLLAAGIDGCEDVLTIELLPPPAPRDLIIYTGFSPNGDGVNEVFTIKNIEYFPENSLRIFNRWGNEVYRAEGYTNATGWTGDFNGGIDVPDGTYFYVLYVDNDRYSGYVQVNR